MSLWSYLWWKRVYSNVKIQDDIEEFKIENEESMKIKISEAWTKKAIEIKSPEVSIEIKSPEKDENTRNWCDRNELKKKKKQLLLSATNLIAKLK